MANPEHLAILKQGVKVWNEWRHITRKRVLAPDLSGIELADANLIGANFAGTQLTEAQLTYADLTGAQLMGAHLDRVNLKWGQLEKADLCKANLGKAQLKGARLIGANATGAYFGWADLTEANLSGADLAETNFIGAHLTRANLEDATLYRANLCDADIHRAELRRTNLSNSFLLRANLSEAIVVGTIFANTDLGEVKGLETVRHGGPSTIGMDTIYRSKGNIPEIFLRGCGVPENFITFMHSLAGQNRAFDFYSCFISYSSKDTNFAERLHADLQSKGVRVWFAPEDLKIGDKFRARIDEAIKVYDKLLIVLSENSINSSWVEKEVEAAFEKENREKHVVLFPIRLDDSVMETDHAWAADIRRTRHIGDFTGWKDHDKYQKAFERLMRDLKASEERK